MSLFILVVVATQAPRAPELLSADSVRSLVAARVSDRRIPGLAVGRLVGNDTLRVTAGSTRAGQPGQVSTTTVFEIGSISKAFTGVLLADMVLRGEVGLDDPVAKYLPPGTRVPEKDGVAITLRHLTTHTSGLPRMPGNFAPGNPEDPYSDYDAAKLLAFLSTHQLRRAPGTAYEYSNLGAGLLGWALANRARMPYSQLLRERILEPLGMRSSDVTETAAMQGRVASGHDQMGEPTHAWHLDALAGAGAIRSTLDDMLRFAAAARDTIQGPLARVMALSERESFRVDSTTAIGLGWHRRTTGGRTLVWHNGGTGGFRSMLVIDPGANRAAVVLANTTHSQDALGLALLDAAVRVPALPALRASVAVDARTLTQYPGRYRLTPAFLITITARDSTGIDLQATGQQRFRLFASSALDFYLTEVEASITFEKDSTGKVVALILHQNGAHQRAVREP